MPPLYFLQAGGFRCIHDTSCFAILRRLLAACVPQGIGRFPAIVIAYRIAFAGIRLTVHNKFATSEPIRIQYFCVAH